jgi:adenylate cyclase
VKHVGDEVMFVEADPVIACEIALQLVESFADSAVAPHAGVSYGLLIARGGDYYGSVVNLASRIADLAVPGEVLVTEGLQIAASTEGAVAGGAGLGFEFEPAGRRLLKGMAEPVPLASVRRPRPVA